MAFITKTTSQKLILDPSEVRNLDAFQHALIKVNTQNQPEQWKLDQLNTLVNTFVQNNLPLCAKLNTAQKSWRPQVGFNTALIDATQQQNQTFITLITDLAKEFSVEIEEDNELNPDTDATNPLTDSTDSDDWVCVKAEGEAQNGQLRRDFIFQASARLLQTAATVVMLRT